MSRSKLLDAMKFMRRSMPALALLLGAQGAWAACYVTPGYIEKMVNMEVGRVIIPNDLPVGSPIMTPKLFPLPLSGTTNKPWTCRGGGTAIGEMLQGTEVPGYNRVFTTNVAGIGIRLSRYFDGAEATYYPHTRTTTGDFREFNPAARFQVELFKIAAVTGSGPLSQGTYTRYYSPADNKSVLTTFLSGLGITIITPSCTVDLGSRNISVQFGRVPQSNFKGRGTTTGDRSFSIKLNCKAGQNAQNTVYLRMDATPDPSNEQGVLKITQGSTGTATGVGIQVVDNQSVPVKFGEDALVGSSKDGDYVLPYTARYYQTGASVTPGRADGAATFTLDYK